MPTISEVHCNPHNRQYIEQSDIEIKCVKHDTPCGDIKTEFGITDIDVIFTCDHDDASDTSDCTFDCSVDVNVPVPVGSVQEGY